MTIYTTSSSAAGVRITATGSNSGHTILDGVALESTNSSVIVFSGGDGSLTVGGYAIGGGGQYAVDVDDGAQDIIVNILGSGHLFGGGILLVNSSQLIRVNFINAGNVYANDTGYSGSDGVDKIINSGFLGVSGGNAINSRDGDDEVYNSGTIQGDVVLGNGNDRYESVGSGFVVGAVHGNAGVDTMLGGDARDEFFGGTEADMMFGGAGSDTLFGESGADTIHGGEGNDNLDGGVDGDFLHGSSGDDTILGGSGNDDIFGGTGDDTINGGDDDDRLYGGADSDHLSGGAGDDILKGQGGSDVFNFEVGNQTDRIRDWEDGVDLLDFSDFGLNANMVLANAHQVGDNVRFFGFGGGDLLIVENEVLANITIEDIIV